jgi:hypothetical protein
MACLFYVKTGNCKFGSTCKFDHPPKPQKQAIKAGSQADALATPPAHILKSTLYWAFI